MHADSNAESTYFTVNLTESDAESWALADVNRQVADADKFDSAALKGASAELGKRVLAEVLKLLA